MYKGGHNLILFNCNDFAFGQILEHYYFQHKHQHPVQGAYIESNNVYAKLEHFPSQRTNLSGCQNFFHIILQDIQEEM